MDENQITISPEMYLVIQGQIGNIGTKAGALRIFLSRREIEEGVYLAEELQTEIVYLMQYMPRDASEIRTLRDADADTAKSKPTQPRQRLSHLDNAIQDAEEGYAVFMAMCDLYDATGEVVNTLRSMVAYRLSNIETFLRKQIGDDDIPF